jgi:hypothetical protein
VPWRVISHRALGIADELIGSAQAAAPGRLMPLLSYLRGRSLIALSLPGRAQAELRGGVDAGCVLGLRPPEWRLRSALAPACGLLVDHAGPIESSGPPQGWSSRLPGRSQVRPCATPSSTEPHNDPRASQAKRSRAGTLSPDRWPPVGRRLRATVIYARNGSVRSLAFSRHDSYDDGDGDRDQDDWAND